MSPKIALSSFGVEYWVAEVKAIPINLVTSLGNRQAWEELNIDPMPILLGEYWSCVNTDAYFSKDGSIIIYESNDPVIIRHGDCVWLFRHYLQTFMAFSWFELLTIWAFQVYGKCEYCCIKYSKDVIYDSNQYSLGCIFAMIIIYASLKQLNTNHICPIDASSLINCW